MAVLDSRLVVFRHQFVRFNLGFLDFFGLEFLDLEFPRQSTGVFLNGWLR